MVKVLCIFLVSRVLPRDLRVTPLKKGDVIKIFNWDEENADPLLLISLLCERMIPKLKIHCLFYAAIIITYSHYRTSSLYFGTEITSVLQYIIHTLS